jgi:hypothetical protein
MEEKKESKNKKILKYTLIIAPFFILNTIGSFTSGLDMGNFLQRSEMDKQIIDLHDQLKMQEQQINYCSEAIKRQNTQPAYPTVPEPTLTNMPLSVPSTPTITNEQISNWKTYNHINPTISFSYPPSWVLQTVQPSGNPHNTSYTISGKGGSVWIEWGSGFGGACPPINEKLILSNNIEVYTCQRVNENGTETWELSPNDTTHLRLQANSPVNQNETTILTILSTLTFNK